MTSGILIQARMSSTRFPGKMLADIGPYGLVEFVYRRCLEAKNPNIVAVITSLDPSDDKLYDFCIEHNIKIFRGNLDNVLSRYIEAADNFKIDTIVRVCGDSPFVDVEKIDEMLEIYQNKNLDYVNFDKTTVLWGLDSEVISTNLLKKISTLNLLDEDKEHVTLYIKKTIEQYKSAQIKLHHPQDQVEKLKLTVDYREDLELCKKLLKHFEHKQFKFSTDDVDQAIKKELK